MRAGDRDRLIAIHQNSSVTNDAGIAVDAWVTYSTEWAKVKHNRGQESDQAGQVVGSSELTFTVPYNNSSKIVDNSYRIVLDGIWYDIMETAPIPGGRPEIIEIKAKQNESKSTPTVTNYELSTDFSVNGNLTIKSAIGF